MSFTYLASPYSSPDLDTMIKRYKEAMKATKWLLEQRIWTYSPIVHCHEIAVAFGLPRDFAFWHEYNRAMLESSERMLILTLEGWQKSGGVAEEVEHCRHLGLPVNYLSPSTYNITGKQ